MSEQILYRLQVNGEMEEVIYKDRRSAILAAAEYWKNNSSDIVVCGYYQSNENKNEYWKERTITKNGEFK